MKQNYMTTLRENLECLEGRIAQACRTAGRDRSEVELMAVSKTFPAESLLEAVSLGLTLFGENRVQEFSTKTPLLGPRRAGLRCHLIGHLQSNKAPRAAELFDGVDSVDSLRLAERLNEAAGKLSKRIPILLEIKLSAETAKTGLDPQSPETAQFIERLPGLANIEVHGLMTIAPWGVPADVTRACFRSLRVLRDRWAAAYPRLNLPVLSMGMSGDFELAIAEGSTRVRLGTALFGRRAPVPQTGRRSQPAGQD